MSDWELESPANQASSEQRSAGRTGGGPGARRTAGSPPPASPGATAPQTPSPARKRKPFPFAWLGIAAIALLIGLMAGFFIGRSQSSESTTALLSANARMAELQSALTRSEDRNEAYYRQISGLKTELEQATASTSTTIGPSGHRDSYSDGVYLVGKDIPAGTYKGVVNGALGYWARLKGTDGSISSIIENAIPKGPFVLTLASADMAVELRGVTLTPQ